MSSHDGRSLMAHVDVSCEAIMSGSKAEPRVEKVHDDKHNIDEASPKATSTHPSVLFSDPTTTRAQSKRSPAPSGRKMLPTHAMDFQNLLRNTSRQDQVPNMILSPKRKTSPANAPTPKRAVLPPHLRPHGTPHQTPPRPSLMNQTIPWAGASELKVQLKSLPAGWGTLDVYKHLSPFGNLDRIEVSGSGGELSVNGYVIFRPAPQSAQWIGHGLTVIDQNGGGHQIDCSVDLGKMKSRQNKHSSPERTAPASVASVMTKLDVGMMRREEEMLILFTAEPAPDAPLTVKAKMDRDRKMLEIMFAMQARGDRAVTGQFKLCMNLAQIRHASELTSAGGDMAFLITMEMPPLLYRRTTKIEDTHDPKVLAWSESQTWFRQTGIDRRPDDSKAITQLQRDSAVLDIGRWLTYRLAFSNTEADRRAFQLIGKTLVDHNVPLTSMSPAVFNYGRAEQMWTWNDPSAQLGSSAPGLSVLSDLHMMAAPLMQLDYAVRYQLEVCLSHGVLNECNISADFLQKLASIEAARAGKLLEKVVDDKKRFHNPMDIFRLQGQVSVRQKRIPRYCAMVPAAVVTPSTMYFSTPVMETSNRVIREYRQYGDRFLRVKFTDERYKGRIMASDGDTMNQVLTRVYRTMKNGITVGDRHYDFLAFGNAQFREHGAYFFASTGALTADHIRQWMGNFTKIQVVAKYASRVGQCFSTTRAMSIGVEIARIPDIERNGFCFTDGVGKISPFLAQMIADEFGLPNSSTDYPSVFQFRLAGCKGVLAVDPAVKGRQVQIRPSQEKFPAKYHGLEICRISQFSSANLNVQIILVLNALGVSTQAFCEKMRRALSDLLAAMTNEQKAQEQLHRNVDFSQTTLILADMIYDGFMTASEPFLISCLRLWHSWMIKYLKEKARIPVEHGAFVFGCVDETASLKGHYYSTHGGPGMADGQLSDPDLLPEIFLQIPDPDVKGRYKVVKGVCVLARNPSLHPGDARVVRAIDVPQLHHLKNCVVLPQTGDRDLGNMCSGGDLDGDDYLVMWDEDLIPSEWDQAPMDYQAPPPVVSAGPVTVDAMTSFFVKHMKNDNLGRIAMAHRYWADKLPGGVKEQKCLELAQLHSMAVDYAKTGVPAVMPKQLRVSQYPHWAESAKGKNTYKSYKVLGQLYDMVQRKDFHAAWNLPFDNRIQNAYQLSDEILQDALDVKLQYDEAVRRVMAQHGIKSEFEVWTTFVLEHNSDIGDYKFAETLSETVTGLKQCHQELCYEKAGTTAKERDWIKMGPFIAAMYTVTAREVTAAWSANNETKLVGGRRQLVKQSNFENMPFMSFPWIFAKELGHIARRRSPTSSATAAQPSRLTQNLAPKNKNNNLLGEDFVLETIPEVSTAEGIIHEGDLLDLHHKDEAPSQAHPGDSVPAAESVLPPAKDQVTGPSKLASHEFESTEGESAAQSNVKELEPAKSSGDGIPTNLTRTTATDGSASPPVAHSLPHQSVERAVAPPAEDGEDVEDNDEAEEVKIVPDEQASALDALERLVGS